MTDAPPDTPIAARTFPPPSRGDQVKGFIGDLARPFAIISTSLSAAIATVVIAFKVEAFEGAAIFIGAVYVGVGGIYTAKAWEAVSAGKRAADVEIAKATTPGASQ